MLVRVGIVLLVSVDNRYCRGNFLWGYMMVGNDSIDTGIVQHGDLLAIGDSTVDGDHQVEFLSNHALDELLRQTVPVFTIADLDLYRSWGKEGKQTLIEDSGACQSVGVKVAMNIDFIFIVDRGDDTRCGDLHPQQKKRGMKPIDVGIDQSLPVVASSTGEQSGKWASAGKGSDDLIN